MDNTDDHMRQETLPRTVSFPCYAEVSCRGTVPFPGHHHPSGYCCIQRSCPYPNPPQLSPTSQLEKLRNVILVASPIYTNYSARHGPVGRSGGSLARNFGVVDKCCSLSASWISDVDGISSVRAIGFARGSNLTSTLMR